MGPKTSAADGWTPDEEEWRIAVFLNAALALLEVGGRRRSPMPGAVAEQIAAAKLLVAQYAADAAAERASRA